MTPRRPGPGGDDAPNLMGVKTTDSLLDRLSLGAVPVGAEADDAVLLGALAGLAKDARRPAPTLPSLDDLLLEAGLVLNVGTDEEPGGLEPTAHADLEVLGPADGAGYDTGRLAAAWQGLARSPAGEQLARGGRGIARGTRRGLVRIGVDPDGLPRVSPMLAVAAAVVVFGLAGVATGALGADPLVPAENTTSVGDGLVEAADVVAMLDKARQAQLQGDVETAQYFFSQASGMVVKVRPADRAQLTQQVASVGAELGIRTADPVEETGDDPTPATPTTAVATTRSATPASPTATTSSTPPASVVPSTAPTSADSPTSTTTTTSSPTPSVTPTPTPTATTTPVPTASAGGVGTGETGGSAASGTG